MADRPRPPRARQPAFFLDDFYTRADDDHDSSPPDSSVGHNGVSSADFYRSPSAAPAPTASPAPRNPPPSSFGPAAGAHPPQVPAKPSSRSTAINSRPGHDSLPPQADPDWSPRSSFSEEPSHLHLRHPSSQMAPADAPAVRGQRLSMSGLSGMPVSWPRNGEAGERDSFFMPPPMPWMRAEPYPGSERGSRPASPPSLGNSHRTSSAGPLPFYPQGSHSHFSSAPTVAGTPVLPSKPKKSFTSNLLTGPVDKPWLRKKDIWARLAWWTTVAFFILGVGAAAVVCFFAVREVPNVGRLCQVFEDDFSGNSIDGSKWQREVSVSGFGNGEFQWTTANDANSFVQDGHLYIVPTLTWLTGGISEQQVLAGYSATIPGCTGNGNDGEGYMAGKPTGAQAGLRKRQVAAGGNGGTGGTNGGTGGTNGGTGGTNGGTGGTNGGTGGTNGGTGGTNGGAGGTNGGTGGTNGGTGGTNGGTGGTNGGAGGTNGGAGGNGNGASGSVSGTRTTSGAGSAATGGGGANGVTGGGANAGGGGTTNPCAVSSGGNKVVNPVQSARLTTRLSANITYGRVEVRAKLPTGDWLWPSIWMLPLNPIYGAWPLSGEIDIMQARGNSPSYPAQGSDFVSGSLNWGPSVAFNGFPLTRGWWEQRRTPFSSGFHTFTLEWTEDFLWIYVDKRTQRVLDLRFNKQSFFERGKFPLTVLNGTNQQLLQNPWLNQPNSAPFNQPFYLILDVAVGGTNGFFEDSVGGKPWFDRSASAMRDFTVANGTWYPTWPSEPTERGFAIDYVKMWQKC